MNFRAEAHRVADWIADYLENPGRYPVLARVSPGDIRDALPARRAGVRVNRSTRSSPTSSASSFPASPTGTIRDSSPTSRSAAANRASSRSFLPRRSTSRRCCGARRRPRPSSRKSRSPGCASWWVCPRGSRASSTTPHRSRRSMRWLPHGKQQSRACAPPDSPGRGDVPALRVYCSEHAHSSVDKAVILLGLGQEGVAAHSRRRRVPACVRICSPRQSPRIAGAACCRSLWSPRSGPPRAPASIRSSGIAEICARERVWLHVDAAYAGVAAMVPGYEWILRRRRPRRFDRLQSAQVAVHAVRSARCSTAGAWTSLRQAFALDAGVSEDQRRGRRRQEPDGHRHPARTPLPRAEAVDGAAALRRATGCARGSPSTCGWPVSSPPGSMRASGSNASRRSRSASSASGCAATHRRASSRAARSRQRVGRGVPLAHAARRPATCFAWRSAICTRPKRMSARAWALLNEAASG